MSYIEWNISVLETLKMETVSKTFRGQKMIQEMLSFKWCTFFSWAGDYSFSPAVKLAMKDKFSQEWKQKWWLQGGAASSASKTCDSL